ncbi:MAG: energy-coupling factor transporter transmembrane component T [Pontiella sp.]
MPGLFANFEAAPVQDGLDIRTRIFISFVCSCVAVYLDEVGPIVALGVASLVYVLPTQRIRLLLIVYLLVALMTVLSLGTVWLFFGSVEWALLKAGSDSAAMAGMFKTQILASCHIPFLRLIPSLNVLLALSFSFHVQTFVNAMKMLHLPRIIFLPLMVFCRFVPEFILNVRQLREAVLLRGFSISFGSIFIHPVQTLRLTLVPLVIRTLRMADNLAVAAEMKRVGYVKRPTVVTPLKFGKADWMVMAVAVLLGIGLVAWQVLIQEPPTMRGSA